MFVCPGKIIHCILFKKKKKTFHLLLADNCIPLFKQRPGLTFEPSYTIHCLGHGVSNCWTNEWMNKSSSSQLPVCSNWIQHPPMFFVAAAAAKSLQSCPTLCDLIDGSPPGSSVPGILQARTLEWVAISFSNAWKWKVKVKSLSRIRLLATPWTAIYQALPSMGFSRQEYWSGVPLPSPMFFVSKYLFHIKTDCCFFIYSVSLITTL